MNHRLAVIARRTTDRGRRSINSREFRVYTVLSESERVQFDRLRRLIGMNRSQAARYLILKEIAFAMGRHAATTSIGMWARVNGQTREAE